MVAHFLASFSFFSPVKFLYKLGNYLEQVSDNTKIRNAENLSVRVVVDSYYGIGGFSFRPDAV